MTGENDSVCYSEWFFSTKIKHNLFYLNLINWITFVLVLFFYKCIYSIKKKIWSVGLKSDLHIRREPPQEVVNEHALQDVILLLNRYTLNYVC
jgi:hypothetical protein